MPKEHPFRDFMTSDEDGFGIRMKGGVDIKGSFIEKASKENITIAPGETHYVSMIKASGNAMNLVFRLAPSDSKYLPPLVRVGFYRNKSDDYYVYARDYDISNGGKSRYNRVNTEISGAYYTIELTNNHTENIVIELLQVLELITPPHRETITISEEIADREKLRFYYDALELDRNEPSDPVLDYDGPVIIEQLEWSANFSGDNEYDDDGAMLEILIKDDEGELTSELSRQIISVDGEIGRGRLTPKIIKNRGHSWFDIIHYDEINNKYKIALNRPLHFPQGVRINFVNTTGTPKGELGKIAYNITVRELV